MESTAISTPKVSIIIPVYNVEKYLRKALDSVINQTLKELEIICIDDCSTDNSLAILKEYAKKDNRIVILEQKVNQGQGIGRNRALDIAKGECIMFLDPDDWYELNACERAYNQLTQNNNDYVYINYCRCLENNEGKLYKSGDYHLVSLFDNADNPDIKLWELHNNFWINANTHCRAYKREFLNKYNIRYDETIRLCEDVPFFAKCIANAKSVSVIKDELYNFYDRQGSTSKDTKIYEGSLISRRKSYDIIKASEHSKELMLPYLYYAQTVLAHFNHLCDISTKIEKEFYNKIRDFFIFLDKNEDLTQLQQYSEQYKVVMDIIKTPYYMYRARKIFKKIFNIEFYAIGGDNRLIISLFGISVKLRLKNTDLPVQDYKEIIEKRIKPKLKNKKPINVLFLSSDVSKWKYTNLYNKFKESEYFKPQIAIFPYLDAHKNKKNNKIDLTQLYEFHKNKGFDVEYAYAQKKCYYRHLKRFCPDIIIYEQTENTPKRYELHYTYQYVLPFWTSENNELQTLFEKDKSKRSNPNGKFSELSKSESDNIFNYIENLVLNSGETECKK